MNESPESKPRPPVPERHPDPADRSASKTARLRSPRLAWAITFGETALLAGAAVPLIKYWLMLPAPIRIGAASLLCLLLLLVTFRIIRFHRRQPGPGPEHHDGTSRPASLPSTSILAPSPPLLGEPGPNELPCKKRLRNTTVLVPSSSSTCP